MEILFSKIGARELIQQKSYANKLWVDTEKAKLGEILSNYATKDKYEEGIKLIEISKDIYSPTELLTLKNSFKATVDKTRVDLADVQADKAIMNDPKNALINLHDSSYLPNLLPKQRQDKIEKANVALKIWGNEQEKKVKEAEKLAHDTEDREIGNLFMAGKFKDAYVLAYKSQWISGDEKRVWANSITTNAEKKDPTEDDAATYTILLSKVMDPTLTDEQKPKIAREIITSGNLKTETKKSLIKDLLEDQLFKDPWFKRSESAIKEGLGWTEQMGFFNLKDPLKAQTSYRDVTNQLITDIKKQGLRGPDIYKRAKELVLPKQMEVWDMLMGVGKGKEEKPKQKYEIGKIYTNAEGKKAKYIGNGKFEWLTEQVK